MSIDPRRVILSLAIGVAAASSVHAQPVFRCGGASRMYSDRPCSKRVVDTADARIPVNPVARWMDQNQALARAMHPRPGESADEFALRRRRAGLLAADRAECARLDKHIPVEQARTNLPDAAEVSAGQAALKDARKRFKQLRC